MTVLRKQDEHLASILMGAGIGDSLHIATSKSGHPVLRINSVSLHSLYDPVKDAGNWVRYYQSEINSAECICVFGFGMGYHIRELVRNTDLDIIVFEPRLDVLKTALQEIDLTGVLSKIALITGSEIPALNGNPAVLEHKPSFQISHEYFEKVRNVLTARDRMNGGVRVLVAGPIYGGSLPVARYCASALIRMGHTVEFVDSSYLDRDLLLARDLSQDSNRYKTMVDHLTAFASETVMARCERFQPDIVLALAQAPLSPEHVIELKQKKVTCAYWFVEDFRIMNYWKQIASHYDHFFTIQRGTFFDALQESGHHSHHFLPMAAEPSVHKDLELSQTDSTYYGSDLSFVGAGYYNRRHFFQSVLDFDFKVWGTDWEMNSDLGKHVQRSGERLEDEEIARIYSSALINLNLHSSTYHRGINPFGDFVNPRTFEIPCCGGFQLVDMRDGLDEMFRIGEEIVVFNDLADLRMKIKHYLANPDERKMIAEKGRQRVLQQHTYEHRMQKMLDVIAEGPHEPAQWERAGEDVERLIQEAGQDSELGGYLERFRKKGRITLKDVGEDISDGEGELSDTEILLLMMREFVH